MNRFVFVGERRSRTAEARDWTWKDGRLAAKQLFDALVPLGVDPAECRFANAYEAGHLDLVQTWAQEGWTIIGMGEKAQRVLRAAGIAHRPMVHPAARGSIRLKANYAAHVGAVLAAD